MAKGDATAGVTVKIFVGGKLAMVGKATVPGVEKGSLTDPQCCDMVRAAALRATSSAGPPNPEATQALWDVMAETHAKTEGQKKVKAEAKAKAKAERAEAKAKKQAAREAKKNK